LLFNPTAIYYKKSKGQAKANWLQLDKKDNSGGIGLDNTKIHFSGGDIYKTQTKPKTKKPRATQPRKQKPKHYSFPPPHVPRHIRCDFPAYNATRHRQAYNALTTYILEVRGWTFYLLV
jgi:hypothetical protein